MFAPTCVWSPADADKDFLPNRPTGTEDIASCRARAKQYQRCRPSTAQRRFEEMVQGRNASEHVDSLVMNLRQAKRELTIRDKETRRLRSALIHLEHTLSQRERDFRDTVLCLQGERPPPPRQEWLQKGVPSAKLRLQVHLLQRAVASKQDHIDHLNRQASLGFLREAREQAEEYRLEARRLARALAIATGADRNERLNNGTQAVSAHPRANDGDVFPHDYPTRAIQSQLGPVLPAEDAGDTPEHLVSTQFSQPLAQTIDANVVPAVDTAFGASQATICRDVATPKSIQHPRGGETWSNDPCPKSMKAWQSDGARFRPRTAPRLTNRVPQSWLRYSHPPSPRRPYLIDATTIAAPTEMTERRGSRLAWGADCLARSGKRRSLRRRVWESGGEQHLSKYSGGLTDDQRTSRMAEKARLRSSARQNAAERSQALALDAESRRLQKARKRRAYRMRLAQEKIARYRERRLRELDARLNRRLNSHQHTPVEEKDLTKPDSENGKSLTEATAQASDEETQVSHSSKSRRNHEHAIVVDDATTKLDESRGANSKETSHSPGDAHIPAAKKGDDIPRSTEDARVHSSRGISDRSGGGGQRSASRALGKPPLPPSRDGSRFGDSGRKSALRWEGNSRDGSFDDGTTRYDMSLDSHDVGNRFSSWDDDDDADEVKTEETSRDGEVLGELWGDEEEGAEIRDETWRWQAPGMEHSVGEWPRVSRVRSGGHYRGVADDRGATRFDPRRVEGVAGRGVSQKVSAALSNGQDMVQVLRSTFDCGSENAPQRNKVPSWDAKGKTQHFVGVRREEMKSLRGSKDGNPRKVGPNTTSEVEAPLHETEHKGAPLEQGGTSDQRVAGGSEQIRFGRVEGRTSLQDEDLAYRDSFEPGKMPVESWQQKQSVRGDLRQERVTAADGGLGGEDELGENPTASSQVRRNTTRLGDTDGARYIRRQSSGLNSRRIPLADEKVEHSMTTATQETAAPVEVGAVTVEASQRGYTGNIAQMPKYQDEFASRSNGDVEERALPDDRGDSVFVLSPPSEEEEEAFSTSIAETEIASPPKRRPLRHPKMLRAASAADDQDQEHASGIYKDGSKGDAFGRRRHCHSRSTSDGCDQHVTSPPSPHLQTDADQEEGAIGHGITSSGESGVPSNSPSKVVDGIDEHHRSPVERETPIMSASPTLIHNSATSLYNLSPDSDSLSNSETSPSRAVDATPSVSVTRHEASGSPVNGSSRDTVEGKDPIDTSLHADNSRTSVEDRVDNTAGTLVERESSYPELSVTSSDDDKVSCSSSKKSPGKTDEIATDWACSDAGMNPENGDRLTSPRIVQTVSSVDSRTAENGLEKSVGIGSAGDAFGRGVASDLSVAPIPSSAASSVDRGGSPLQEVDNPSELEAFEADVGSGEERRSDIQEDRRSDMSSEKGLAITEGHVPRDDGSESSDEGVNITEDDGYF